MIKAIADGLVPGAGEDEPGDLRPGRLHPRVQGLYVGAGAGANFLMSEPNKGFGLPGGGTFGDHNGVNFDTGWMGQGAVGWGFGNGFRAELEADFYRNQFSGIQGLGGADGFENKYGGMADIFYTSCADGAELCEKNGLTEGYLTEATVKGAKVQLALKYSGKQWRPYTISVKIPSWLRDQASSPAGAALQ
jgi:hypothetical protein